ncbi:pre-toxin TG domain-containing protein [Streptococcus cristatus]|uniref:pre-toxin TG domain-containing protein n=1 Tax=Streptococcus cristatus TaxID=45634 RepID=UPI001CBB2E84
MVGAFFSVNDTYRLTTGKDPETGENTSRLEAAGWLLADIVTLKTSKVAKGAKAASKGL